MMTRAGKMMRREGKEETISAEGRCEETEVTKEEVASGGRGWQWWRFGVEEERRRG